MPITIEQIREDIAKKLGKTYYDPQLHIRPSDYGKTSRSLAKLRAMAPGLGLEEIEVFYPDTRRYGAAFRIKDGTNGTTRNAPPDGANI